MNDFYQQNKNYYERNANSYENSSWYFANKYKDKTLTKEIEKCAKSIGKNYISVLEIGPGTGYLLSKLLQIDYIKFDYTGIEHSQEMSNILYKRYQNKIEKINIINESISIEYLTKNFTQNKYDLIIGSSILHHLPDYEEVIRKLSNLLNINGVIYFVREPLFKDECIKSNMIQNISNSIYGSINNFFLRPSIKKILWPWKIKQEDPKNIAIQMFINGVSNKSFLDLCNENFKILIYRRYNRRATNFLSYLENKWLKFTRKDIFGNTMFAMGLQKIK